MFLTHINYYVDKNCSYGVVGAVVLVNVYVLQYLPDTIVVSFLTGCACIAAAVSKGLKRIIKQSRPPGAPKVSPGMPSNHATSLSFLCVATVYGLQRCAVSNAIVRGMNQTLFYTPQLPSAQLSYVLPLQVLIAVYSMYAAGLRVAWGHHTVAQVAAGYLLGFFFAILSLAANYSGYTGSRSGGRVDDLPLPVKAIVFLASVVISAMAIRSIIRGAHVPRGARTGHLSSCGRRAKSDGGGV
ncbi:PAP2 superfamily [Leishmania braziliensis]|nr:PAP2 superfamily [Leishmania braziliensis]